jgi:tRNA (cytidine/uridine-2'-O-)-methyltransferase
VFHIVLYEPEIPPNTGNIIRLCANVGAHLHLIEPLGFTLNEARVRRAGLDYHELASVDCYANWSAFREKHQELKLWAFSTRADRRFDTARFQPLDGLVFGPETRGLPAGILSEMETGHLLRLPMKVESRSLNLSNTVAVALYEALRQNDFPGLT